jgi:hypothetical protein
MAMVLVAGATIKCTHGGICKLSQGTPKLTVGGNAVITSGMETKISFLGGPNVVSPCPGFPLTAPPVPTFCIATLPADPSGVSSKLTVDGIGALLDNASGQATNVNDPSAKWSVISPGQSLLKAS